MEFLISSRDITVLLSIFIVSFHSKLPLTVMTVLTPGGPAMTSRSTATRNSKPGNTNFSAVEMELCPYA